MLYTIKSVKINISINPHVKLELIIYRNVQIKKKRFSEAFKSVYSLNAMQFTKDFKLIDRQSQNPISKIKPLPLCAFSC